MVSDHNEDPVAIARRLTSHAWSGKANVSNWFSIVEFFSECSSWSDPRELEPERLKRLATACAHLDRVMCAPDDLGKAANFSASIVIYWSAVDGTPIANPIWESVRSSILHEDRVGDDERVILCTPTSRLNDRCRGHFNVAASEDQDIPKTKSGAIPIVDRRRPPEPKFARLLYWDIRRARRFVAMSMLKTDLNRFVSWERMMSKIAVDIACNWRLRDAKFHADMLENRVLTISDVAGIAPSNYASGWAGMEKLLEMSEGDLQSWLWDEIRLWAMSNASLFEARLAKSDRERTETCDRHCAESGWIHDRPICEVLGLDESACEESVVAAETIVEAVRDALKPYLGKNLKRLNASAIPPQFVL